ncbi:aldo/keto reductase [Echinicola vietnamensis]|uniref:Putative oxidoreductase, aryl-alcohol dehydrogenase like protein n=1 Tax=Echinicola vietnamensis (strain DSM 17526 / LMG 23754 / KMM 6221) TaxID=926556 RepID=L0G467_ECHVK|nr:aldo/keto reductase [Echinicola vietnamensis]AGA80093.1 putative oxidoreductase, aryl-alcohol dehydrogenase like protein [Echinicola vietnamensis DSM 17526]
MHYNQLGKSNIKISEVSFGCMSLKGSKKENIQLIHQAIEHGINYFDTADLYDAGENEKVVGEALKGLRQDVVLATKVGNELRADGSGWDWNPRKSYILKAVDKSLKRLKTDYIDLYQLHGGTLDDPIDETIEAFELLKSQGKIREYGISSIRPNVIRQYVEKSNIAGVMLQYSLLDRRPEESVLDLLEQNGISVLVRGGYAKGMLLDKPAKEYLDWSEKDVRQVKEKLMTLSKNQETVQQVALKYPLAHAAVTTVVSGIRTYEQLLSTMEALEAGPAVDGIIQQLKADLKPNFYEAHR